MPTITLIGMAFIVVGGIIIAFTPAERIVQVTSPAAWGANIAVLNSAGTEATIASIPYAEPGKVLAWDNDRKLYRWVEAPSAHQ